MIRGGLNTFIRSLNDLLEHLALGEAVARIASVDLDRLEPDTAELVSAIQEHLPSPAKAAQFMYSTVIVNLYGALEAFVERTVEEFVQALNGATLAYTALPARLISNHRRLSGILADRIEAGSITSGLTVADVVGNLHTCLSGSRPFTLNASAFAYHSSNVRTRVIEKMLTDAGALNPTQVVGSDPRYRGVAETVDPGSSDLFYRIDDLADRRNEVAHGDAYDLLSPDFLRQYIAIVKAFGSALFELAVMSLASAADTVGAAIGNPYKVIASGKVACFEVPASTQIRLGDSLVAYSSGLVYRSGPVKSIQVNRVTMDSFLSAEPERVGLGLDFKCKAIWTYRLVST